MSRPASSQRGGGAANHQSRTASPALSSASKGSNAAVSAAGNAGAGNGGAATASQNQQQQQQQINASLKSLLGQPVTLTLSPIPPATEPSTEQGLLWAHDVQMGLAVLEVPRGFPASSSKGPSSTVALPYPTNAAAYPTPQLSSLKVAAQGGDSGSSRTSFNLVKLRRITSVKPLQDASASKLSLTPCREVNVQAAEARERAATGEALKRAAKIGVGVSKLGQDVFDALSKT